jgi:hypothetical protein
MPWLRWLSVPAVLLTADQGWLGGLEQLQVLVLSNALSSSDAQCLQLVEWLGTCDQQQLPPRLLVLGINIIKAEQAASWKVRRRLQRHLSSSGCEVVVGVDLDYVTDPALHMQLTGLPVGLQQALE